MHKDQGKRNSSRFVYSIDKLQVWKEDQRVQAFKVFVYLKQKISDFKDELNDELFQVEGSNVGQNLQFNFCNYLILIFLCKKSYFRFR